MTERIWAAQDLAYLRTLEAERNALVGPTALYYSLVRGAHVDPLYNEPVADPLYADDAIGTDAQHDQAFHYAGPYSVVMAVVFERSTGRTPEADEGGFEARHEGEMGIAYTEWFAKVTDGSIPKEGDVCSVNGEWWDVVAANQGGYITDGGRTEHVGYKVQVRKRDRFTPERKV